MKIPPDNPTKPSNRKILLTGQFLLGLLISGLLLLVITKLFPYALSLLGIFGEGLALVTVLSPKGSFVVFFLIAIVFLAVNILAYILFRKIIGIRKGLKWGLLFLLINFTQAANQNQLVEEMLQSDQDSFQAIERQDASACEKVTGQNERDYCYGEIATDTNDVKLCDKITGTSVQSEAIKSRCYADIGAELKDFLICNKSKYQSDRGRCLSGIVDQQ